MPHNGKHFKRFYFINVKALMKQIIALCQPDFGKYKSPYQ